MLKLAHLFLAQQNSHPSIYPSIHYIANSLNTHNTNTSKAHSHCPSISFSHTQFRNVLEHPKLDLQHPCCCGGLMDAFPSRSGLNIFWWIATVLWNAIAFRMCLHFPNICVFVWWRPTQHTTHFDTVCTIREFVRVSFRPCFISLFVHIISSHLSVCHRLNKY